MGMRGQIHFLSLLMATELTDIGSIKTRCVSNTRWSIERIRLPHRRWSTHRGLFIIRERGNGGPGRNRTRNLAVMSGQL